MTPRLDDDFLQFVNLDRQPEPEDIVKAVMILSALLIGAFVIAMVIGMACMMVIR